MRNGRWLLPVGQAIPELAPAPEAETINDYRNRPDVKYHRQEERDGLRKSRARIRLRGRR